MHLLLQALFWMLTPINLSGCKENLQPSDKIYFFRDVTVIMYKYYVSGHYPSSCFYLTHCPALILKHCVSETGFSLRLQVKSIKLNLIDRARSETGPSSIDWPNWVGFTWNIVFLNKNRNMGNVQKHNICINVPSSQNFRSYCDNVLKFLNLQTLHNGRCNSDAFFL
jgi:hypothetical protein